MVFLQEEQQTEATAALGYEEHALEEMIVLGSTTTAKREKERVNAPSRDRQVMAEAKVNLVRENQMPIVHHRRAVNSAGGKAKVTPAATLSRDLLLHLQ